MRDTIKSKYGYSIHKGKNKITGEECYGIYDGDNLLFVALIRSYDDYKDEKEQNEMFNFCEVFTTIKGSQAIYWRDEEIDTDYITIVPKKPPMSL